MSIDLGFQKAMYSLEQAASSNNITFMERYSARVLAADLGAGGQRAAVGVINTTRGGGPPPTCQDRARRCGDKVSYEVSNRGKESAENLKAG